MLSIEIWKDIQGYEGKYQISNHGRVKSFPNKTRKNERIYTGSLNKGYKRIVLTKNGIKKKYFIHRLVAQAFIPNPNNYPQVNHKDEDKNNNNVDNLEWCTAKYNNNYGTRLERVKKTCRQNGYYDSLKEVAKDLNRNKRKVRCITTGKEFNSLKEAGEYYNCGIQDGMSNIKNGRQKTCGKLSDGTKLEWEYIEEE